MLYIKAEQKYLSDCEKLKMVESILKSPNLNKITKNLRIEENSLKDYKKKSEKRMIELWDVIKKQGKN